MDEAVTWQGVYGAVTDSRRELGEKIDSLGDEIRTVLTTHEHSLTVLEQHLAASRETELAPLNRLESHGKAFGELKDRQREDEAATAALEKAGSRGLEGRHFWIAIAATVLLAIATSLVLIH